jgi:poly(A) polymerase Pap1
MIDPDTWDDAYLLSRAEVDLVNEEDGATFDVQKNPLAAESNAPADQKPQRYDRILFRKHCPVYVETFQLFGLPNAQGECGSDHFGINAVLRIGNNRTTSKLQNSGCSSYQISFVQDETDLRPLLIPSLPSQQDRNRRETAVTRLTKLLTSDSRLSDVLAAPLGSYAMDTYFSDSDVDVLIIGSLAPTAFFNIATARLKTIGECFQGLHYINSLVPVIEVELLGIKFDVQYCQAPQLTSPKAVEARSIEEFVFDKDLIAELPPPALRPLNTYRDAAYLLRSIPCLEAFRTAHRFLSLYLRRRGLYSAKFGYLGGVHLSLMLNHVIKHLDSSISIEMNAASLVRTFATYYAQFSWESEVVRDPSYSRHDYRRTSREPVVILAIHSPTARPNVASSCSKLSVQTLTREFGLARDKLAKGDWEWILREQGSTFQDFTARFGAFLVVSIDMWNLPKLGDGPQRGFLGSVESRMPLLMVNLGRIEGLYGQAWPFSLSSQQDEVEVGKQSKAYYVVGVSAPVNADAVARKAVQNKVIQVAHNFETVTKSSDHYDEKCMLIQLEMASRKKLLGMILEVQ